MKYGVLFAVLMLFTLSSRADMVAKDSAGNSVTLQETACTANSWMKARKAATMFYEGKRYQACWRVQAGTVVVIDSSGDVTPIPMNAFRPETRV